jgi:hypothetical protein
MQGCNIYDSQAIANAVLPLAMPYQAAGFEVLAKELIAIPWAEPTTADPDREIVDGWAAKLGLSRWTIWKRP